MNYRKRCQYDFSLRTGEKPLEIIPVGERGYVPNPISPFFIILYIFSLPIPLLLNEPTVKFEVMWFILDTLFFFILYLILTSRGRTLQNSLEQIAAQSTPVSATIIRKEKVFRPAESLEEEVPFHLVAFSYVSLHDEEEMFGVADIHPSLYDELTLGQYVLLREHPSEKHVAVLERDVQRFIKNKSRAIYS